MFVLHLKKGKLTVMLLLYKVLRIFKLNGFEDFSIYKVFIDVEQSFKFLLHWVQSIAKLEIYKNNKLIQDEELFPSILIDCANHNLDSRR